MRLSLWNAQHARIMSCMQTEHSSGCLHMISDISHPTSFCCNSTEVTYSTSRDLKRQLREVAPMNSSKSLMFCPNGPSSAVSPLMENKCDGDRMATPSVFGRTEDTVGNSIPGFSGGKYGGGIDTSANLASQVGFPKY